MSIATDTTLHPIENGTKPSWFLERIYGMAEAGKVSIFEDNGEHRPNETTRFELDRLDQVDQFIQRRREHGPMYFNMGLQTANLSSYKRGGYTHVYSTTCLYADLDLFKEGNDKLYPSLDDAMAALDAMPLPYSMLIHSGGGLYPIWLLNEPLIIDNDEQAAREVAAVLHKAWQNLLRRKLQQINPQYALDSTGDLSRMLKIPGSLHPKHGTTVTVVQDAGHTYDRSDFEPFLDDPSLYGSTGAAGDSIKFTEGLELPDVREMDRFERLKANNDKFRATWDRKRTDESFLSDPSTSNYCHSLAIFAVNDGWTDDEILALHFWWRGTHGELGGHRPDRTASQIASARKKAADNEAARGNGQTSTPAKPEAANYTVGNATIVVEPPKKTKGGKVIVPCKIRVDGKTTDIISITSSKAGKKDAAREIVDSEGVEVDLDDAAKVVKKILVEADEALDVKIDKHDGDTMRNILKTEIEPQVSFPYRTDMGRVFDKTAGRETSRAKFVERFTNNKLLALAATAIDSPRGEDGTTNRTALISAFEKELKLLWGDLTHDLPTLVDAKIDRDSAAAVMFLDAIEKVWTAPKPMTVETQRIDENRVQVMRSNTLIQIVREGTKNFRDCPGGAAPDSKWQTIHPGLDAWFRLAKCCDTSDTEGVKGVTSDTKGGSSTVEVSLAMKYTLVSQIGRVKLEGVNDQAAFRSLGTKYGAFVKTSDGSNGEGVTSDGARVPGRASGGKRIVVLSRKFAIELLDTPDTE